MRYRVHFWFHFGRNVILSWLRKLNWRSWGLGNYLQNDEVDVKNWSTESSQDRDAKDNVNQKWIKILPTNIAIL